MSNSALEFYVDIANEHFDDESMKNSQALVLARQALKDEGADDQTIRDAIMKSRFVMDADLNLRGTMELIR